VAGVGRKLINLCWRTWWAIKRYVREASFEGHPDTMEYFAGDDDKYREAARKARQHEQIRKAIEKSKPG
jgi:hypothetical protein